MEAQRGRTGPKVKAEPRCPDCWFRGSFHSCLVHHPWSCSTNSWANSSEFWEQAGELSTTAPTTSPAPGLAQAM